MITLPTGTKIWIIAGITDMRCGFNGLASKVQNTLKDDPFSGHIFVFRGRSGKMVKILWALAGDPGRESAPDASSVIHATGGDRVATSQTDRTAWHPDITRDKTRE
ncbi:IS66 family insertion sequence hypothetical protein [Escherichia coli]|uniref:IS66 family insertion sequence element accessory protein TnpB n=1 Tax=Escherichia coli TaxID=562 RepID=UPI000DF45893|nr:IS66 family insertion sequence element accessory protein TnpB [Escherichia coli]RCZ09894.1 IS66 family insertion sequence hypothetical protein [Escherichia coli]